MALFMISKSFMAALYISGWKNALTSVYLCFVFLASSVDNHGDYFNWLFNHLHASANPNPNSVMVEEDKHQLKAFLQPQILIKGY